MSILVTSTIFDELRMDIKGNYNGRKTDKRSRMALNYQNVCVFQIKPIEMIKS